MSFLSIPKDIFVPTLIVIFCLAAIVFIFVGIPEIFREKEGEPIRHDLKPIQMPLPEDMALILTSDKTTFYPPIPPECEVFAMITEDGCLIQWKDEREPWPIPLGNLSIIPTGVDGVPFMDERLILRYSISAGGDRYVETKYRLFVPNLAISPPEDRHLAWWFIARGEDSEEPLHSTRKRNPDAREVCFIVKGFDNGKALLSSYDEVEKTILSEGIFVVDSERIYRTCNIGDIVFLRLDNYTLHC
ncbi:hypothetical protein IKF04_02225 [Candidatus Saccharibacteria bacterium]|nr:hypothetical protein [Candidatus Saccharibacteria bacterium]